MTLHRLAFYLITDLLAINLIIPNKPIIMNVITSNAKFWFTAAIGTIAIPAAIKIREIMSKIVLEIFFISIASYSNTFVMQKVYHLTQK